MNDKKDPMIEIHKHADALYDAALAYQDLCSCYRVAGKRPSEKLFRRLDKAKKTLENYRASYPEGE